MNAQLPSPDGPIDAVDESVLSELAALYDTLDPVPEGLADEICLTIALRELDADLAALANEELVAVRSTEYQRVASLTFSVGSWSMLVTVTTLDSTYVRLDGWLTGAEESTVELRERSRTSTTTAREGRFVFARVERGFIQFLVTPSHGGTRPVITPHVEV